MFCCKFLVFYIITLSLCLLKDNYLLWCVQKYKSKGVCVQVDWKVKHLKIYIRNAIPIGKKENVNNTVHVSPESMYIKSLKRYNFYILFTASVSIDVHDSERAWKYFW